MTDEERGYLIAGNATDSPVYVSTRRLALWLRDLSMLDRKPLVVRELLRAKAASIADDLFAALRRDGVLGFTGEPMDEPMDD